MGLTEATKEVVCLRNFLTELDFPQIFDNLGTQTLAENPIFHARSGHIDIRHHYVREALKEGNVKIQHVPTEDMTADYQDLNINAA